MKSLKKKKFSLKQIFLYEKAKQDICRDIDKID